MPAVGKSDTIAMGWGTACPHNLTQAAETLRQDAFRAIDDILISVVMPVFNRVELTLGALDSLKRQTHPTWELILVDDGSTQDIGLLKAAVDALGPRARYVRQDNAGPVRPATRDGAWRRATMSRFWIATTYSPMDALHALYHKVSPGGFVIVDDYVLEPCARAIHDFRKEHGIEAPMEPVDGAAVWWRVPA